MEKETDPFASFFQMRKPCANCPFRKEGSIELRPGRLKGIVGDLLANDKRTFTCHKTLSSQSIDDIENADEECDQAARRPYYEAEKMCAGAAAYLLKSQRPSVGMRYALITGSIPKDHWDDALSMVIDVIDTTN